jgi:hypothetical protein
MGLSLCLVVLLGLAVNGTGPGIELPTMLPLLAAVAVLAPASTLLTKSSPKRSRDSLAWRHIMKTVCGPVAVFAALAAASVAVSVHAAESANNRVTTTELSIVASKPNIATVTVTNYEHAEKQYRLVMSVPTRRSTTFPMRLHAGETRTMSISTAGIAHGKRITASLYLGSRALPYRRVWLTMADAGSGSAASRQ